MGTLDFQNIIGTSVGDEQHMLGKFLYFTLSSILVDKDDLSTLCKETGMPFTGSKRLSVSDAFRSATGDIRGRIVSKHSGERKIYTIYCRDNEHSADMLSRELVKETRTMVMTILTQYRETQRRIEVLRYEMAHPSDQLVLPFPSILWYC